MRNKVEIRAFALEQVVKMRCMSNCKAEDLIKQATMLEEYIVGTAQLEEYEDPNKMLNDIIDMARERPMASLGIVGALRGKGN